MTMHLDNRKRQRRRQESFLFVLMGLILLGLLLSGYFLFVDKVLPGLTRSSPSGVGNPVTAGTSQPAKPGEAQVVGVTGEAAEGIPGEGQIVSLYFGARDKDNLVKELRKISPEKNLLPLAQLLIRELLKGPFSPEARRVLPEGTQLRSIFFHQGTFFVDFSRELAENHPGGALEEVLTIYSIVDTLTELDRRAKVRFLVNGIEIDSLRGHVGLRQALTRYEPIFLSAVGSR